MADPLPRRWRTVAVIVQYRVFGGLASTFGGIVTLICLAVFRLTTNSPTTAR